ncbi:hypothetical protein LWI28_026468 [Acer negundo]|uniref:Uncharacterized protein n=1 Tax=Acer negundo TaxID=4023 RepID=A0AAD5NT43_ACENE|nr:hypothetical protein LWI28_026468 [Acer negundo]
MRFKKKKFLPSVKETNQIAKTLDWWIVDGPNELELKRAPHRTNPVREMNKRVGDWWMGSRIVSSPYSSLIRRPVLYKSVSSLLPSIRIYSHYRIDLHFSLCFRSFPAPFVSDSVADL